MYFVRKYKAGPDYDPRQKHWAVFHCDVCGEDEDVDITGRTGTFRFNASRLCPFCKCHGKEDKIIALRKEIEELSATKDNIAVTIEKLTVELEQLSEKEI